MSQSSPDRSPPYHRLWGVGLGLGVAYWILESAIDTYIFSEGPFYDRLVRPDLNEAWMRVLVFLLLVVFGGYAQRCLSQRRVAASELDQSEERFAKVFHRGPVAVVVSRLEDGVCVDVNDAFLRMCGYRRDEVVGRSFLELNTWVNPDDRVAVIRRLRREGSIRGMETSFRSKSGDLRIGRFSAERIKIGNAPCMIAIAEDVTDRNRAAEALRLSEDRYRNLAEAATDAIITIDDSSTIIYANPAASALFGYPPGGLLNEPLTKLIPPALRGNHEAGLRRYLETGKRKLFWDRSEFQGRHQDGSEIPLEISFGEQWQGNRRTFTAIVRDITERKKAEAALRESEERLRLTLDAVSGGGWDWNIATGEVYFSDSWIASLGYRREEVQPHVSFWNSILHPDDMPRVMEVLNAHFEGRTDCYECEIRQRTRSGAYRWNLDRGMVVSRDT
ncbi:MAG: PAS domain S-box protein, partial [Phycisphaerae bacterium]